MTGVGVFSLAGVVVNNAIVLIDYTNKLRERGMDLYHAVISAGATRLRPVLLTAITTILGLLPMVTGISFDFHKMSMSYISESTQWWQSMALVVIFGLMIATILTLIVVPTLYSLLISTKTRGASFIEKAKQIYWKPVRRYPV
jgi:multidrug efflux pump subunit AcrB